MKRNPKRAGAGSAAESAGFRHKSAPEQLADAIERDLRRGTWAGLLPSIRNLAAHYGSNLVTIFHATQVLIERGVLINQGPKRRHRIHSDLQPGLDQPGFNKVALIVAASKKTKNRPVAAAKLTTDKNDFCLIDLGAHSLKGYKRELGNFFADHKPSHVILIGGDPEHLAFLDELGVKVSVLHLDTVDWAPALAQLP